MNPAYLVILNCNNEDVIKPLCESLVKYNDYPAYLIFVDNGSYKDNSREYLKSICNNPYNHYIELPENVGTTKGWNVGIKYINERFPEAKYIALINSDMTVDKPYLKAMVDIFENQKNVGMVSNQLREPNNPNFIQNDGPNVKEPFHFRMGMLPDFKPYVQAKQVQWGHMGFTLFDNQVFKDIGLFDEQFFIYSSDFDIQIRLKMAGYNIWHCPESVAYHKTFHTCNQLKQDDKIKALCQEDGNKFHAKWSKDIMNKFKGYLNYWDRGNNK